MQQQLTVLEGPDSGKTIFITGKALYIGRDEAMCSLVLSDTEVSRQHARLSLHDDGAIHLEDMGSSNGTYVNEEKIGGPKKIRPGDRIRLGSSVLNLVPAAQVAHAPPAAQAGQATASVSIGRDPSNDLVISDPQVSRKHARIDCQSGTYYLTNLSRTGTTYVDGQQVSAPAALKPSSWVQIQGHNYLFDGSRLLNEKAEVAAAFSTPALNPERDISFVQALLAPLKGMASIKWLLGSILAVIPIVGIFANGYRYRLLKNGQSGTLALPAWENWGELFVTGLQFFLVRVFYLLLPALFLLFVIAYAPPAWVDNLLEMVYYPRGQLLIMSMLFFVLAWSVMPIALAHFAATGSFKDSFQLSAILQLISVGRAQYLSLILLVAGLWLAVSLLAWIIPYIGFVFGIIGAFYIYIVSSLLFGDFYGRSRAQIGSF